MAMTEDHRVLYDNAGEIRNTDILIHWSIAAMFVTLHSVGLAIFATQLFAGKHIPPYGFTGGIILGVLWYLLARRMLQWIGYWNSRLEAMELDVEPQAVRVFGGNEYQRLLGLWISTSRILTTLIFGMTVVWIILFIFSLFA